MGLERRKERERGSAREEGNTSAILKERKEDEREKAKKKKKGKRWEKLSRDDLEAGALKDDPEVLCSLSDEEKAPGEGIFFLIQRKCGYLQKRKGRKQSSVPTISERKRKKKMGRWIEWRRHRTLSGACTARCMRAVDRSLHRYLHCRVSVPQYTER